MALRRSLSWSSTLCDLRADRQVVAPGVISARALCEAYSRFRRRPLYTAGKFDRAAIMTFAVEVAHEHQKRRGGTWKAALSISLQGAWAAAKQEQFNAAA